MIKGIIAHLKHGLALITLIITSFKRLKSFIMYAKFRRTNLVRAIHVPNNFKLAIVITAIKGESDIVVDAKDVTFA